LEPAHPCKRRDCLKVAPVGAVLAVAVVRAQRQRDALALGVADPQIGMLHLEPAGDDPPYQQPSDSRLTVY